jgi:hypothetical protein
MLENLNGKLNRYSILKPAFGIESHSEDNKIRHIKFGIFKSKLFLHQQIYKPDFTTPDDEINTILVPTSWQVGKNIKLLLLVLYNSAELYCDNYNVLVAAKGVV